MRRCGDIAVVVPAPPSEAPEEMKRAGRGTRREGGRAARNGNWKMPISRRRIDLLDISIFPLAGLDPRLYPYILIGFHLAFVLGRMLSSDGSFFCLKESSAEILPAFALAHFPFSLPPPSLHSGSGISLSSFNSCSPFDIRRSLLPLPHSLFLLPFRLFSLYPPFLNLHRPPLIDLSRYHHRHLLPTISGIVHPPLRRHRILLKSHIGSSKKIPQRLDIPLDLHLETGHRGPRTTDLSRAIWSTLFPMS